jgi:hypothetical protein
MARVSISPDVAGRVLFDSDRTCCVCRVPGKPTQLHHVDEDNSNSVEANLAVLCLECHNLTQIRGGFHRKLDAHQILLYKQDWTQLVARNRTAKKEERDLHAAVENDRISNLIDKVEELRARGDLPSIIFLLDRVGNVQLRNKYIDELMSRGTEKIGSQIFYRAMQDRLDLLNEKSVEDYLIHLRSNAWWSQLGRSLIHLKRPTEAAEYYLRDILESLSNGNTFSTAYYLKELGALALHLPLFEKAYSENVAKGDLWWQFKSLQELGWKDQAAELLKNNDCKTSSELLKKTKSKRTIQTEAHSPNST